MLREDFYYRTETLVALADLHGLTGQFMADSEELPHQQSKLRVTRRLELRGFGCRMTAMPRERSGGRLRGVTARRRGRCRRHRARATGSWKPPGKHIVRVVQDHGAGDQSWIVLRSGLVSMRINEISPKMAPSAPAPPADVPMPLTGVPAWLGDVPAPPVSVPSQKWR